MKYDGIIKYIQLIQNKMGAGEGGEGTQNRKDRQKNRKMIDLKSNYINNHIKCK